MSTDRSQPAGSLIHVVTLTCKDAASADRCLQALATHGRPDALTFRCEAYEFGRQVGSPTTIRIVERWRRWQDLDDLLRQKVVPALPLYNQMLTQPFDPVRDTVRLELIA